MNLSFGQINAGTDQRVDPVSVSPGQSSKRLPRVSGESPVFGWVSPLWREGQLFVALWCDCLAVVESRPQAAFRLPCLPEEAVLPSSIREGPGAAPSSRSGLSVWPLQI